MRAGELHRLWEPLVFLTISVIFPFSWKLLTIGNNCKKQIWSEWWVLNACKISGKSKTICRSYCPLYEIFVKMYMDYCPWFTISVIFQYLKLHFLKANGSKESPILLSTLINRKTSSIIFCMMNRLTKWFAGRGASQALRASSLLVHTFDTK